MREMGRDFLETCTLTTKNAGIIGVKGGVRVWLDVNMGISWVSGASMTVLGNLLQLEAA